MKKLVLVGLLCCLQLHLFAKDYLGAEIRTQKSFLYGKFEVKMKSVECSGMLTSFFTFYDSPDFADNWNEIDIEILGRYQNEVQFNTITPGPTGRQAHEKRQVLDFNPHADFHTYSFSWTPTYIAFDIDGKQVYCDSGSHIAKMNKPQKIMMNIWSTKWEEWTGKWTGEKVPLLGQYEYVKYYKYNKETKSFKLNWEDEFETFNESRWQLATHSFDGNLVTFTPANASFKNGKLYLVLTKKGGAKATFAKIAPEVKLEEAAKVKGDKIKLVFSEKLDKKDLKNISNYLIQGISIDKVSVVTDYSTEKQTVLLRAKGLTEIKETTMVEVKNMKDLKGKLVEIKAISLTQ